MQSLFTSAMRIGLHAFTIALASTGAQAQSAYPIKPVRVIVPFPPGGPSDVTLRIISTRLSEVLGQQIIVDNRGEIGRAHV